MSENAVTNDKTVSENAVTTDNYIDALIVDCNELPKFLMDGQYVGFCNRLVQMVHRLAFLRESVNKERAEKGGTEDGGPQADSE